MAVSSVLVRGDENVTSVGSGPYNMGQDKTQFLWNHEA